MAHRGGVKHLVSASWYSYYGGVSGFNFLGERRKKIPSLYSERYTDTKHNGI